MNSYYKLKAKKYKNKISQLAGTELFSFMDENLDMKTLITLGIYNEKTDGMFGRDLLKIHIRKILKVLKQYNQNLHLNINPQNILVDNTNTAESFSDLKFRFIEPLTLNINTDMKRQITNNLTLPHYGTIGEGDNKQYTDPERIIYPGPITYTEKNDIWSIGILIYRIIMGNLPLNNSDIIKTKQKYWTLCINKAQSFGISKTGGSRGGASLGLIGMIIASPILIPLYIFGTPVSLVIPYVFPAFLGQALWPTLYMSASFGSNISKYLGSAASATHMEKKELTKLITNMELDFFDKDKEIIHSIDSKINNKAPNINLVLNSFYSKLISPKINAIPEVINYTKGINDTYIKDFLSKILCPKEKRASIDELLVHSWLNTTHEELSKTDQVNADKIYQQDFDRQFIGGNYNRKHIYN